MQTLFLYHNLAVPSDICIIGDVISCFFVCLFVCFLRVDLNLCIKVGDFGFTRETSHKASQSQKCPVKWMPPEMLQDGISTEKTDVVGCINLLVKAMFGNIILCVNYSVTINNITHAV